MPFLLEVLRNRCLLLLMVGILSCILPFCLFLRTFWMVSNHFEHSKYKHSFFILLILSILPKNQENWFILPVLYCCAPIINLFTTCFLSEIFSSFICLVFVYTYFRRKSIYNYVLCLISFLVAIMCKRENLALLTLPTIEIIYLVLWKYRCEIKKYTGEILKYTSLLLIVCIYFLSVQNVFDIEK